MSKNRAYDIILDPITNIAPSTAGVQKVTRTIPAVANFQDFFMELLDTMNPLNISLINLKVNNTIIQQMTGPQLNAMNIYNGLPAANAFVADNQMLVLSQRRNRIFGGGIQALSPAPAGSSVPVVLTSGAAKDLETVCGLNCNSKDSAGNQLDTVVIEIYLVNTPAGAPSISMVANGYDPYPGGPGLIQYIDYKTYNATVGTNVLDKNTAYNIGDGMRLNLDQIFYIPDNPATLMDNWIHYLQSTPIKQRNQNVNQFIEQMGVIHVQVAGMFVLDTRELLYGDETLPIGMTAAQFRTQVDIDTAGNVSIMQVSQGTLFPTLK